MKLKGIFILGMLIFSGCAKPENISSANKNPVDDSTKAHLALISHEDGKRYVELSIPKSFLLKMPHKNLPEEAGLILTSNYHQTTGLRPIKPYQSKNIGGIKSSVVILLSPENKNTNDMAQWEKLISATPKKIYNLSVYHQKGKDNSLEILRPAQPDLRQNLIYVCNISVFSLYWFYQHRY
jgi:hypothetical protein